VKTNFPMSTVTANDWMRAAKAQRNEGSFFSSGADLRRKTRKPRRGRTPKPKINWREREKEFFKRVDFEAFELDFTNRETLRR
jgi:hypothetical protein